MLIKRKEISSFGLEELNNIDTDTHAKTQIKKALLCYKFQPHYPDDDYDWLTCVLALKSVCKNNFGVGALLADSNGDITEFGHNEVFSPYFRSDRHAEMVVLSQFEENHKNLEKAGAFCLYTSLEPCPMCLIRLLTSGIGFVKYVAFDPTGGMLHMADNLPEEWIELLSEREYIKAKCSKLLEKLATEICMINMDYLNDKIRYRASI